MQEAKVKQETIKTYRGLVITATIKGKDSQEQNRFIHAVKKKCKARAMGHDPSGNRRTFSQESPETVADTGVYITISNGSKITDMK